MGSAMPLEGHSLAIFVVCIVMMSISTLTVLLRCFVRVNILHAFGWDDILMVAALALFICLNAFLIIGSMHGIGHRFDEFPNMEIYQKALLWWWLAQILYIWSSTIAKISIALALLRLAVNKYHRVILWSITATVIVVGAMLWLVVILICNPVSYFWTRVDGTSTGTCISMGIVVKILYFYSAVTIVCDLGLGTLPALLVWQLQMNTRTKFAVGGILGLGACKCGSSLSVPIPTFLYSTYQIAIWSVIETGLGITAGSLITLRPLFRWLLDEVSDYRRNTPGSEGKYRKSYPLYSLQSEAMGGSRTTKYWRPDIDPNENTSTVITASPPRKKELRTTSSQEALNPELSPRPSPNHVKIEQTFVRTVMERQQ
ncbi:hypothetical protein N7457_008802 [Penicillium paradoxum]|uniref:uncharacterized protein n=1 Tax=Penicillium paradoxum TaxID=176176 RepID=UPI002546B636|nr:uncharacterized protein N7457_008802 [Penicillium paradoxum]KAJ5773906.1 hypothetical protein N7457_008802 [Penicillium paradoxum]